MLRVYLASGYLSRLHTVVGVRATPNAISPQREHWRLSDINVLVRSHSALYPVCFVEVFPTGLTKVVPHGISTMSKSTFHAGTARAIQDARDFAEHGTTEQFGFLARRRQSTQSQKEHRLNFRHAQLLQWKGSKMILFVSVFVLVFLRQPTGVQSRRVHALCRRTPHSPSCCVETFIPFHSRSSRRV